ncbi:MAG: hypothetical protein QXG05_08625, partial [Nitrososphaerota archaeon]
KISKQRLGILQRIFLEAKWFTNHIIAKGISNSVSYTDYKVRKVNVKVGDKFEERQLRKFQSLQMSKKVKGCIITAEEEGRGSIPVVPAWKLLLDKESYLGSF